MVRILVFLILILQVLMPAGLSARSPQEIKKELVKEKKKLEEVLNRIELEKKDLEEAALKEKELLKKLGEIEKILEEREAAAAEVADRLSILKGKIDAKATRVGLLKKEKELKGEWLRKRMIALYKVGSIGPVKALFSSDSYISLLRRLSFMKLIMQNDMNVIEGYRLNMQELSSNLNELEKDRKETEILKKELINRQEAAREELKRKKQFLSSISRSKVLHEKALKEMEASSINLGQMISKLESTISMAKNLREGNRFYGMKGHLALPAEGKIISFYGKMKDPKFNTTVFQKGIEIAAPNGTEIRAIFDGRVLYADWFRGYGKIIIIDHGDGYYSLSAHASELLKKVDDPVKGGEVVARVGDTGSLKGPHLYFEIRDGGKPVDPLDWLNIHLNTIKGIKSNGKIQER